MGAKPPVRERVEKELVKLGVLDLWEIVASLADIWHNIDTTNFKVAWERFVNSARNYLAEYGIPAEAVYFYDGGLRDNPAVVIPILAAGHEAVLVIDFETPSVDIFEKGNREYREWAEAFKFSGLKFESVAYFDPKKVGE